MSGPNIRFPAMLGTTVAVLFFGVLGGWSVLAPLSTAVAAGGEIIVESHRKTVQHLEGGIIAEILARDGDRVNAGQALIRLDTTQAEAALRQYTGQLDAQRALAARLIAERDREEEVTFPADLARRAPQDEALQAVLDGQRRIFSARKTLLSQQRDILGRKIGQIEAQITGAKEQIAALEQQRFLVRSETDDALQLLAQGLMQRTRVLALQREAAALDGRSGELHGAVSASEQSIGETLLSIASLESTRADEVARDLREAENHIAELEQRVRAHQDILTRQNITAPVSGEVVGLKVFSAGGVIAPGQELLDLVPAGDSLGVTVHVSPSDIDSVRPGQEVQVMLTAYSQRMIPPLPGRLVTISADRLVDKAGEHPYYSARVEMDARVLASLHGVSLVPGMPVQAMIVTGERTVFESVFAPLRASLKRSMREE